MSIRSCTSLFTVVVLVTACASAPTPSAEAQVPATPTRSPTPGARIADTVSAPISNIRYQVTYDQRTAAAQFMRVAMTFDVGGTQPVLLSLPAWTPGAYEISNFSRFVANFRPTAGGRALGWDKIDHDTWRVFPTASGPVTVTFDFTGDSLDNAMTWMQPDFVSFNGTNIFLYPEGRGFDWASTVTFETAPGWGVATGMPAAPGRLTFAAPNYHDLVDMPTFVGSFDLDSARIMDRWVRYASYPKGAISGARRQTVWSFIQRIIPVQVAVFDDTPFDQYTVLEVISPEYGGASGLEHSNSHFNVYNPAFIGHEFHPSLIAHEIFHAWNVKRLRPAPLWPYRYESEQPTQLLWMSEGVTDYYADVSLVRAGIITANEFYATTAGKIGEVWNVPAVALEDASLSTWVHPTDGTSYIYYPKGSLAGFLLDILIRDASDNQGSLDDVMRILYETTYEQGQGFTDADFWQTTSRVAAGRSFEDFWRQYVDGREPYPWERVLPLAGLRLVTDTVLEPRLGIYTEADAEGIRITRLTAEGAAQIAGVTAGDYLVSIDEMAVTDPSFGEQFRARYRAGQARDITLRVRRGEQELTLTAPMQYATILQPRIVPIPNPPAKALRIREGILTGR